MLKRLNRSSHCGHELRRLRLVARPFASPALVVAVARCIRPDAERVQPTLEIGAHDALAMPIVDALLKALGRTRRPCCIDGVESIHQVAECELHVVLDALV